MEFWSFSKGEVLRVIGYEQDEKDEYKPWLHVQITGEVKTGYEPLTKIEGAPMAGWKTGYIKGTKEALIGCK